MSSDIDDDGDYSSIDGRDPKMDIAAPPPSQPPPIGNNGTVPLGGGGGDDTADSESGGHDGRQQHNSSNTQAAYSNISIIEAEKSLSRREKNRYPSVGSGGSPSTRQFGHSRKSRSKERPDASRMGTNIASPVSSTSPINSAAIDSERIRERERELEKIHRRSRELMLSPRFHDSNGGGMVSAAAGAARQQSSRDGSMDRRAVNGVARSSAAVPGVHLDSDHGSATSSSGVINDGWRPMAPPPPPPPPPPLPPSHAPMHHHHHHHLPPQPPPHHGAASGPPPLPPRRHSPPGAGGVNVHSARYKSPSPAGMQPHHGHHVHHHGYHSHGRIAGGGQHHQNTSLRRRVQSPNRRDFKDFSRPQREFRSPMKLNHHHRSFIDEDDDSGADSLGNDFSSSGGGGNGVACNCLSCNPSGFHRHSTAAVIATPSSMALVPYQEPGSCDNCRAGGGFYRPPPPIPSGQQTNYPLQTLPNVEERLLQLEGDKDSLHLQVALLSDQIDAQTDKISDLEKVLDDKKDVLRKTEDLLQREMITRSSLETKKLELMSEISSLKLRQAAVEKENSELRKKLENVVTTTRYQGQQQQQGYGAQAPGFDTIITLPPTGQSGLYPQQNRFSPHGAANNSSASTTLQTFGTLPRRSRRSENNHHQLVTSVPIETHFNQFEPADGNGSGNGSGSSWNGERKLSSAHSGSAPSLNAGTENPTTAAATAMAAGTTVPRSVRHQSTERSMHHHQQYVSQVPLPPSAINQQPIATKPKGLKKILGKMRRANSGTLHEDKKGGAAEGQHQQQQQSAGPGGNGTNGGASISSGTDSLRRGGFRASAGSRFAAWMGPTNTSSNNSPPAQYPDPNLPFRQWKSEAICSWLDNLGLYMYNSEVRRHVKTGESLLAMSNHDLENKLGIKSALHRKKILLALHAKQQEGELNGESTASAAEESDGSQPRDQPGQLDHQWVVRWLDDVGLPQYKDAFLEARVDGRVLNLLTVEDLMQLKVTNLLHHLSIRRGVQVLRQNGFSATCLKRRASPEEKERNSLPIEVSLWSNHRVMEWLRHVDLAEYAPNLRGSGVHGGLLIYETRFTAELFASLLSIPASKTLLRRHLSLHFRDLVGREVMQEKRAAEEEPNFVPLTPTARVKPIHGKRSQFSLRRRKFSGSGKGGDEMEVEDLVCPIEA